MTSNPRCRRAFETTIRALVGILALSLSSQGIVAVVHGASQARATVLSDADYRYLDNEFGFARNGFTLTNIAGADAERLDSTINDPVFKASATSRRLNVAFVLFEIERTTCETWLRAHAGGACPDVADKRFIPGWTVAEQRCISCHLTGTTEAPSFYTMAKSGRVTESSLAAALAAGHAMSPIKLSQGEIHDLLLYINSLSPRR